MKFHFSSNWTSRVRGGKGHEFVVEALGLVAGEGEIAGDGVRATPVSRLVARRPTPSRTWSRTEATLSVGSRERSRAVPLRSE